MKIYASFPLLWLGANSIRPIFLTSPDVRKSNSGTYLNITHCKSYQQSIHHQIGEDALKIQVIFFDNSYGLAESESLDELIKTRRIIAFRRSSGWARVGHDPVRERDGNYAGPERRNG
jgi:hypothetical protein